jgi:hypothetical protein
MVGCVFLLITNAENSVENKAVSDPVETQKGLHQRD